MGTISSARALLAQGRLKDAVAAVRAYCRDQASRLSDLIQLSDLCAEIDRMMDHAETGLSRCRIAVLGDYTSLPFTISARCALLGDGVVARIYEGQLGAWRQEIIDP